MGLKQQKFIFSQLWKYRNLRSRCQQGWFLLRSLSMACRFFSLCLHVVFPFIPVCVLTSSSYKDTSHIGLRAQPSDLILLYLFKGPFSKHSHILRYQGLGVKHEFCGDTIQCVIPRIQCQPFSGALWSRLYGNNADHGNKVPST